jgi:hypothetical protein
VALRAFFITVGLVLAVLLAYQIISNKPEVVVTGKEAVTNPSGNDDNADIDSPRNIKPVLNQDKEEARTVVSDKEKTVVNIQAEPNPYLPTPSGGQTGSFATQGQALEERSASTEEQNVKNERDSKEGSSKKEVRDLLAEVPNSYPIQNAALYYVKPENRYPGHLGGPPPLRLPGGTEVPSPTDGGKTSPPDEGGKTTPPPPGGKMPPIAPPSAPGQ